MKNLKFRAWHKEEKRMMYVRGMDAEKGQEMTHIHCFWDLKNDEGEDLTFMPSEWFEADEVILMQSTGLKDSNGVEIFFDDLVEFSNTIYRVELDEDYAQPCLHHPYDALSFGDNREDCTVVGNLYENPELMPIDEDKQPELLGGGV